jgi:hypothetical protein
VRSGYSVIDALRIEIEQVCADRTGSKVRVNLRLTCERKLRAAPIRAGADSPPRVCRLACRWNILRSDPEGERICGGSV